MTSSNLNYLSEAPPPNTITGGGRFSTYKKVGGGGRGAINIQSTTVCICISILIIYMSLYYILYIIYIHIYSNTFILDLSVTFDTTD